MSRILKPSHKTFVSILLLLSVNLFNIQAIKGVFAKTDDYVFLGLMKTNAFDIKQGFQYFSSQEWTAGRWSTNFILPIIFDRDFLIQDLSNFRVFFTLTLLFISIFNFFTIQKITKSTTISLISSLLLVSIPGFQSFTTLLASGPYLLAVAIALVVSRFLIEIEKLPLKVTLQVFILSVFLTTIYQPAVYLILAYPSFILAKERFSLKSSQRLSQSFLIANAALFSNWMLIQFFSSNTRAKPSLNLHAKIEVLYLNIWNLVTVPWLWIVKSNSLERQLFSVMLLIFSIFCVVLLMRHSRRGEYEPIQYFAIIYVALAGIPFTFPWFFVVTENATDLRRYSFASAVVVLIYLSISFYVVERYLKRIKNSFSAALIIFLVLATSLASVRVTDRTADILMKEWKAFNCASESVAINGDTKIRLNEILIHLQGERPVSEDVLTASIAFPNPPTFMIWISQIETGRPISFAPWNINFVNNLEYSENDSLGLEWERALFRCTDW